MSRKGWFIIPGVQEGSRTLEEQMVGITPALAEAQGKTIVDFGCAEALIAREFSRAGATSVHGVDSVEGHIEEARRQCAGLPMTFECADLRKVARAKLESGGIEQYDIVLSLGVAHKMKFPADCVRYSARSGRDLVLIGLASFGETAKGILRSKHHPENTCNVYEIMPQEGFKFLQVLPRSRGETVTYWRRDGQLRDAS